MKAREPRKKVMIKARMRVGTGWRDACILDLSSRGLMIQAPEPLQERSYLELRRGRHVIVARVVWSRDRRAGLCAQGMLPTDAIIDEPDQSSGPPITCGLDRRVNPAARLPTRSHEQSRWLGRTIEYGGMAVAVAACAWLGFDLVSTALARPLVAVEQALGKG